MHHDQPWLKFEKENNNKKTFHEQCCRPLGIIPVKAGNSTFNSKGNRIQKELVQTWGIFRVVILDSKEN